MPIFQGPCKHIKKDKVFKNISKPDILDASIETDGHIIPLQSNRFDLERKDDSFFVYHSYEYCIDEDGSICSGRWYNTRFPLDSFRKMKGNVLHVHLNTYEYDDHDSYSPADITIQFTEKAAAELKTL